MTSITIHGLEDPLDSLIREKARQQGLSLNKTIKQLLAESLGVSTDNTKQQRNFDDLCGIWSPADSEEFIRNTRELSITDPKDWE
ncbi:MAG: hypothetical protein FD168_2289 [Desulfobulbaceae bacterium]|jgi:hypothetical protein|nr:MAG: hypothetical protein FD168_2289 [Desulfobulbaceae bacterium]